MAELLIKVDPVCLQPNEQAGHVVDVREDGFGWTELERKLFVIVRVAQTVEEAKAKYLKDGVPDEVKQARADAALVVKKAVDNLELKVSDEQAYKDAIAEAQANLSKVDFHPDDFPSRANYFDMTKIPKAALDAVNMTRQSLTNCQAEAKAAARSAVEATPEIAKLNLDPEVVQSLHTSQLKEIAERELIPKGNEAVDAIFSASREGRNSVEQPVLDKISAHEIIQL